MFSGVIECRINVIVRDFLISFFSNTYPNGKNIYFYFFRQICVGKGEVAELFTFATGRPDRRC